MNRSHSQATPAVDTDIGPATDLEEGLFGVEAVGEEPEDAPGEDVFTGAALEPFTGQEQEVTQVQDVEQVELVEPVAPFGFGTGVPPFPGAPFGCGFPDRGRREGRRRQPENIFEAPEQDLFATPSLAGLGLEPVPEEDLPEAFTGFEVRAPVEREDASSIEKELEDAFRI